MLKSIYSSSKIFCFSLLITNLTDVHISDTALIVWVVLSRSRRESRHGFVTWGQIGGSTTCRWLHLLSSAKCKCEARKTNTIGGVIMSIILIGLQSCDLAKWRNFPWFYQQNAVGTWRVSFPCSGKTCSPADHASHENNSAYKYPDLVILISRKKKKTLLQFEPRKHLQKDAKHTVRMKFVFVYTLSYDYSCPF